MKQLIRRLAEKRMLHYGVAGATSFAVEYGSFLLLFYSLGWSAVAANTVSFILSLITSFSLNKYWVFRAGAQGGKGAHQLLLYCVVATCNVIVTDIIIHLLVDAGVPGFAAKMLLIVLVAVSNFFVFQKLVFKQRS